MKVNQEPMHMAIIKAEVVLREPTKASQPKRGEAVGYLARNGDVS